MLRCSCIPWFIGSFSQLCMFFHSHFIGISTTICSFVDALHNFSTSLLLHLKNVPIGHWFPFDGSYSWLKIFETSAPARARFLIEFNWWLWRMPERYLSSWSFKKLIEHHKTTWILGVGRGRRGRVIFFSTSPCFTMGDPRAGRSPKGCSNILNAKLACHGLRKFHKSKMMIM